MRAVGGVAGIADRECSLHANSEIVAISERPDHHVAVLRAGLEGGHDAGEGESDGEGTHEPRPLARGSSIFPRH